jgi:hypothetical protein
VSFANQVLPMLVAECTGAGCHSGKMPQQGLSLTATDAYRNLVGVASSQCTGKIRVKAGSVADSYVVNKLTGVGICSGTLMPKADTALTGAQLDLIRNWICQGAPNN